MRAACYDHTGPAREVLAICELPDPVPGPGEVLVRVRASGINPSDVKTRNNIARPPQFERVIPHSDGAGEVIAVGAGVASTRIGERVWLWNGQWKRAFGTAAEQVALPSEQAIPLPDGVPFEVGACVGIPLLTAWRAVHWRPRAHDGETMLIPGGAGAVGQYAIQIARRAGYRIATTVSSPEKAAVAHRLGADLVINYREEDVAARIAAFTDGRGVDRIIEVDLNGNAPFYPAWLKVEGLAVVYGSSNWSPQLALRPWVDHGIELAFFIVYNLPEAVRRMAIAECNKLLSDPAFVHAIAARYPLDEIVAAHEAVESGAVIGNVVVLV